MRLMLRCCFVSSAVLWVYVNESTPQSPLNKTSSYFFHCDICSFYVMPPLLPTSRALCAGSSNLASSLDPVYKPGALVGMWGE